MQFGAPLKSSLTATGSPRLVDDHFVFESGVTPGKFPSLLHPFSVWFGTEFADRLGHHPNGDGDLQPPAVAAGKLEVIGSPANIRVVRIDFFTLVRDPSTTLQAQTSGNEPPPMQRRREVTVASPIPAFLGSYDILEDVRKALLNEAATDESAASMLHSPPRKSPNFNS